MEVAPFSAAKDWLPAIANEITATHEHYTITRNGVPAVALLPVEDLHALEETIFWLERETGRPQAGESADDGPGTGAEEMAALMAQRRQRETGAA